MPFLALVAVVLGIAVILVEPPLVLLLLFVAYAVSGPLKYVYGRMKGWNQEDLDSSND